VSTGEKYVAAAYLVLFATLLLYVALIAMKLNRIQRELDELARLAKERARG
jgi:CcmD family protein